MKTLLLILFLLIPILAFGQTADYTDVAEAAKLTAYPDSTDFQYPSSGDSIYAPQGLKLRAFTARMMRKVGLGFDNLPSDGKFFLAYGDSTGWFSFADSLNANIDTSAAPLSTALGTRLENSEIGSVVQAWDAQLDTWATVTPSANGQSLVAAANYAAMRTSLALVVGTNVQAYDADLTTYAGITPSANVQTFLGGADYAALRTQLGLVIGTNVQAYDADLATLATPTAWRLFYSNGSQTQIELALGTSGQYLKANGTTSAPTWDTPSGAADSSYKDLSADSLQSLTGDTLYLADHVKVKTGKSLSISSLDPDVLDLSKTTDGTLTTGTDSTIAFDAATGEPFKAIFPTSGGAPATADISDVSVTQTELAELETIGAVTISAAQWAGLGGATTAGIALWDDAAASNQLVTLGLSATAAEINTPLDGASVTLTEFQELETIGATTVSANQWSAVGGMPETVTGTELGYTDGVTSSIQTQLGTMLLKTAFVDSFQAQKDTVILEWGVVDTIYVEDLPGKKWKYGATGTILEIGSYTDANTSTFNIEKRAAATPNTSGTDALTADQVADSNQQTTTSINSPSVTDGQWLVPSISATGDVASLSIYVVIEY